jgi:hypothetical protein
MINLSNIVLVEGHGKLGFSFRIWSVLIGSITLMHLLRMQTCSFHVMVYARSNVALFLRLIIEVAILLCNLLTCEELVNRLINHIYLLFGRECIRVSLLYSKCYKICNFFWTWHGPYNLSWAENMTEGTISFVSPWAHTMVVFYDLTFHTMHSNYVKNTKWVCTMGRNLKRYVVAGWKKVPQTKLEAWNMVFS